MSVDEDGVVWEYLKESVLLAPVGPYLFVHEGVPKDAIRWIPSMQMRYLSPAEGDIFFQGTKLPPSCSFHEWVNEMNSFFQSGLKDFRSQPLWRKDRSRGGEALLCLTSTPACFRRSVVVESLLEGGMPTCLYTEVAEFLLSGGIKAVFCGHKPCGDSPFVVRSGVTFIHCDTTYSDVKASDQRGRAVAAVEASLGATPDVLLRGILADGRKYDFSLLGNDADDLVGYRTTDGAYVKAKLLDESYLVVSGDGARKLCYTTLNREEAESAVFLD